MYITVADSGLKTKQKQKNDYYWSSQHPHELNHPVLAMVAAAQYMDVNTLNQMLHGASCASSSSF